MPRLGDSNNSGSGLPTRNPATATAYPNSRRSTIWTFLYIFTMTLVLRNIFFNNYKQDAVDEMVKSGVLTAMDAKEMTSQQKTKSRSQLYAERQVEYEKLKEDVEVLKKMVARLGSEVGIDMTGEAASKIDNLSPKKEATGTLT